MNTIRTEKDGEASPDNFHKLEAKIIADKLKSMAKDTSDPVD